MHVVKRTAHGRTGVGQADEDDLRLHAKVLGARVQRRLQRVAWVQAAAHTLTPCQIKGLVRLQVFIEAFENVKAGSYKVSLCRHACKGWHAAHPAHMFTSCQTKRSENLIARPLLLRLTACIICSKLVDLSSDAADWETLNDDEKQFISHILAFFAACLHGSLKSAEAFVQRRRARLLGLCHTHSGMPPAAGMRMPVLASASSRSHMNACAQSGHFQKFCSVCLGGRQLSGQPDCTCSQHLQPATEDDSSQVSQAALARSTCSSMDLNTTSTRHVRPSQSTGPSKAHIQRAKVLAPACDA